MKEKQVIKKIKEKIDYGDDKNLFFLESIRKVNRVIQNAKDLDQMMRDVLDLTIEIMRCDRAWLLSPCDTNIKYWSIPMGRSVHEWPGLEIAPDQKIPTTPEHAKAFRLILESEDPVIFGHGSENKIPSDVVKNFYVKSQLIMAIRPKIGNAWAFGIHQCSYERIWTDKDIELFKEIGFLITGSLNNLLLVKKLSESELSLKEKITELERVNKLMIGRELRMIELKKELEERLNNSEKLNKQT